MSRDRSERSRHSRSHDPALAAIRRAEQRALAEHAAEMADLAGLNSSDADRLSEMDTGVSDGLEAEAGAPTQEDTDAQAGPALDAGTGEEAGAIEREQARADIPRAVETEIEAAAEELGTPPSQWSFGTGRWEFPKLPVSAPRRSGLEEAQAFFDFSRRFAMRHEGEMGTQARSDVQDGETGRHDGASSHQDLSHTADDRLGDKDVDGDAGP